MKIDGTLVGRLRAIKALRHWTWPELAEALGITKSAIDQYLTGRSKSARPSVLRRLSELEAEESLAEIVQRSLDQFRVELTGIREMLGSERPAPYEEKKNSLKPIPSSEASNVMDTGQTVTGRQTQWHDLLTQILEAGGPTAERVKDYLEVYANEIQEARNSRSVVRGSTKKAQ